MRKRALRAWILGAVVAALVGAAPGAAQAPQTPEKGGVLRSPTSGWGFYNVWLDK